MIRLNPFLRSGGAKLSFLGLALTLVGSLWATACGGQQETPSETTAPSTTAAPSTSEAPSYAPTNNSASPLPTLSSRDGRSRTLNGSEISASGATFTLPEEWNAEPPSSSMRLGQASIPGSAGDGQLTAFHFGVGGGGGLESNLQRWAGQVEQDPGTQIHREEFVVGGFQVTWIEVRGTLKPSTMGTGPASPQPGSSLLGAVVEGPGGPWYFKATGPTETLEQAKEAFLAMLRSVRSAS